MRILFYTREIAKEAAANANRALGRLNVRYSAGPNAEGYFVVDAPGVADYELKDAIGTYLFLAANRIDVACLAAASRNEAYPPFVPYDETIRGPNENSIRKASRVRPKRGGRP